MEKLVEDDLQLEVEALWADINRVRQPATTEDVLAAVRMIAVGLALEPPLGTQLQIYQRLLHGMPKSILLKTTEQILAEYKYPTFPKPAEWVERSKDNMELLSKVQVLVKIYPGRRRMALRKYGRNRR